MTPNFDFLNALSNGPETQIDPMLGEMIRDLDNLSLDEVKSALFKALDFGARYSLASTFVMLVLDTEWKRIGGKNTDPAPWREEIEKVENGL